MGGMDRGSFSFACFCFLVNGQPSQYVALAPLLRVQPCFSLVRGELRDITMAWTREEGVELHICNFYFLRGWFGNGRKVGKVRFLLMVAVTWGSHSQQGKKKAGEVALVTWADRCLLKTLLFRFVGFKCLLYGTVWRLAVTRHMSVIISAQVYAMPIMVLKSSHPNNHYYHLISNPKPTNADVGMDKIPFLGPYDSRESQFGKGLFLWSLKIK